MAEPCFTPGDLVWYLQTTPGGYGFTNRVPAVFLRATARRVSIEVLLRDGSRKRISVVPLNIVPRPYHCRVCGYWHAGHRGGT